MISAIFGSLNAQEPKFWMVAEVMMAPDNGGASFEMTLEITELRPDEAKWADIGNPADAGDIAADVELLHQGRLSRFVAAAQEYSFELLNAPMGRPGLYWDVDYIREMFDWIDTETYGVWSLAARPNNQGIVARKISLLLSFADINDAVAAKLRFG